MKKLIVIFLSVMCLISCDVKNENIDTNKLKTELNLLLDNWHQAAAVADEDVFFETLDSKAIYLGTDPNERWLKSEFIDWGMRYFERDTAWAFKPYNRNWEFTKDFQYAWFDELLETHMGICRGSGILEKQGEDWKIKHYNLALTIANERLNDFRELQNIPIK